MSRGRDDERDERERDEGPPDRSIRPADRTGRGLSPDTPEITELSVGDGAREREDERPDAARRRFELSISGLSLPQGSKREAIGCGVGRQRLRGSDTHLLVTIGAFRIVQEAEVVTDRAGREGEWSLRHLQDSGLVGARSIAIDGRATRVVVLTSEGLALLEDRRVPHEGGRAPQVYYDGQVRPDEAHDAQIYKLFRAEARTLEVEESGRIRVVLEREFQRDYGMFRSRPDDGHHNDGEAFGQAYNLPIIDGIVRFPDLRIEYEVDGRLAHRDVELITRSYSRAEVALKARTGFSLFRAGQGHRRGGTPLDPGHLGRIA